MGSSKRTFTQGWGKSMRKILIINGPNLHKLGLREPEHYGNMTLEKINVVLEQYAEEKNFLLNFFQSNSETELIEIVYKAYDEQYNGIIINAGAYSHTSIALRDALLTVKLPFIEVHISNIFKREAFRHHSYLSDIAIGCIIGLGAIGYKLALEAILDYLK
jgi:3-dehydroquinate dehydratase-2